jgi:hypothetical protein
MRHALLVFLAILLCAPTLFAKPKGKLEVFCTDASGTKLPSAKLKKVDSPIECTLSVKGYKGDKAQLAGSIWAVWGPKTDLSNGESKSATSVVAEGDALLLQPEALTPVKGFPACESFVLHANVVNSQGPLFVKEIKIKQDCSKPKPKKLKGQIACAYEAGDGTMVHWPGKPKVRLMDKPLVCLIVIPSIPKGQEVKGSLQAKGKLQESAAHELPPTGYAIDAQFRQDNGDFESCANFKVQGELTSDGQSVWKGKLDIKQYCPD